MKKIIAAILLITSIFTLASCGVKPVDGRVIMVVEGERIYADYYNYVLQNMKDELSDKDPSFSTQDPEDKKLLDENVMGLILKNRAIELLADEYDIKLTRDEKKAIDEQIDTLIASAGDREAFDKQLEATNMTEYTMRYLLEITMIWNKIYSHITDDANGVIKFTDEELLKSIPDSFKRYRYVVIYNDEGESKAKNLETAENVAELFKNGTDFAELIKEYGEESNMTARAETGYYYIKGEIIEEIDSIVSGLDEGETSEVIDLSYAYFVLQRLPLDNDYISKNFEEFRDSYKASVFDRMLTETMSDIEVKYRDLYYEFE